ncbi:MAG: hypothetical protein K2Q22_09145 [Cytophagales bacterium]|nr:hypothetical protein [Cytophagales bacterium]
MAQHGYGKSEGLEFFAHNILEYPLQPSVAFILSDVLHYLPQHAQVSLLNKCAENLLEGGVIIIRDGDSDLTERHKGTQLTEFISTNVGFNKTMTDNKLHFISGTWLKQISEGLALSFERLDNAKRTSNVYYILKK